MRTRRIVVVPFAVGGAGLQTFSYTISGIAAWKLEAVSIRVRGIAGLELTFANVIMQDAQNLQIWNVVAPPFQIAQNGFAVFGIGMPSTQVQDAGNAQAYVSQGLPNVFMYEPAIISLGVSSIDAANTPASIDIFLTY